MNISNIEITNFKSIDHVKIQLSDFNVLIGANAAGKSNIVNLFQFLGDIFNLGLNDAISLQGGRDYIRNVNIGRKENLKISFEIACEHDPLKMPIRKRTYILRDGAPIPRTMGNYDFSITKIQYDFEIYFLKTRNDFKVLSEKIVADGELFQIKTMRNRRTGRRRRERQSVGLANLTMDRLENKISADFSPENKELELNYIDISGYRSYKIRIDKKQLILETEYIPYLCNSIRDYLRTISVYSIEPKLSKYSTKFTGRNELESDGSNLVIVLKKILEDKANKENFSLLINRVLPFIEDLSIERFSDKTIIASIKEKFTKNKFFPASLMSDGTICVIALLVILYFEEKRIILIEEPERSLHPSLLSKLIDMMKEVSKNKQIIITTHNPEVVKYSDLNNLKLVKRNKFGYTTVIEVDKMEQLKLFLEEELGIDVLYVDNMLR